MRPSQVVHLIRLCAIIDVVIMEVYAFGIGPLVLFWAAMFAIDTRQYFNS